MEGDRKRMVVARNGIYHVPHGGWEVEGRKYFVKVDPSRESLASTSGATSTSSDARSPAGELCMLENQLHIK
jgi:hypothetical protein